MSTNGNGWKPRTSEKWTCPSGQEVWTRPPGPEFTLRLGRGVQRMSGADGMPKRKEGQSLEDYAREIEKLVSDEDLVTVARELIVAMVETPKLVLDPKPGELGPDDTGTDFWPLYQYGMQKYFGKDGGVKVGGGEVEVKDLETFPEDPGVSGHSMDSVHIPSGETESDSQDPGLVHSVGA